MISSSNAAKYASTNWRLAAFWKKLQKVQRTRQKGTWM
ncbi:Uncharacterised protein [Vibrio cholerae]|nr:Uncharacterised protein [Vibrio cholerae]